MLCSWVKDEFDRTYHDEEWGMPLHNDQKLFELLVLESMQAGLSWNLILRRRENMRKAFDGFDATAIADYDQQKKAWLMQQPGVIRNARKLDALVGNAKAFLAIQKEYGSFDAYIWQFVGGQPVTNHCEAPGDIPTQSPEAEAMSKDLQRRGFKFVGPVICYSYMQATGMVNDHLTSCPAWQKCQTAAAASS